MILRLFFIMSIITNARSFSSSHLCRIVQNRHGIMRRLVHRSTIKMMPEGPEVSSFVNTLQSALFSESKPISNPSTFSSSTSSGVLASTGSTLRLTDLQIISGRYTKVPPTGYEALKSILPATLLSVSSKGKFIYFTFDGFTLWSTLGLQGHWILYPDHKAVVKRGNLRLLCKFHMENKVQQVSNELALAYYDTIGYGTIKVSTSPEELQEKLDSLGPCWVHDPISLPDFISLIKKAKPDRYAAVLLMDQSKTSGIGNYILAEALYRSRLYPWVKCGELAQSDEAIELIYNSILTIVRSSYLSQLPDSLVKYANFKRGQSDPTSILNEVPFNFQVYMRERCPLGHRVVKEPGPHKRSIHWVPEVQQNLFSS